VSWVVSVAGRKVNRSPISNGMVVIHLPGKNGQGGGGLSRIAADTDTSDDFGTWTPTWGSITAGTGPTNEGSWSVANGEMRLMARYVIGTGGSVSGAITLDLPSGWALPATTQRIHGICRLVAGGTSYMGIVDNVSSTTQLRIRTINVSGTYPTTVATSGTIPGTWTTGDSVTVSITIPVEPA